MSNQIFRKENTNPIASADELHEYMKVTSPQLWMLLSVILALVIGFLVFASLVTMENTIKCEAEVTKIDIEVPLDEENYDLVKRGMTVRFAGTEGYVESLYDYETLGKGVVVALKDPEQTIKNGVYEAEIVLEKVSPISFLIN